MNILFISRYFQNPDRIFPIKGGYPVLIVSVKVE